MKPRRPDRLGPRRAPRRASGTSPSHYRDDRGHLTGSAHEIRTLDRLRVQGSLSVEDAAVRRGLVAEWLEAVDLVVLQRPILARASEPFPTPLGTLGALHLATALVWRDRNPHELVVATHDRDWACPVLVDGSQLGRVASAWRLSKRTGES